LSANINAIDRLRKFFEKLYNSVISGLTFQAGIEMEYQKKLKTLELCRVFKLNEVLYCYLAFIKFLLLDDG
jgi:hypothetical protein